MAVALVLAAGEGQRLGYPMPKALVPVYGRPMLEWSVEALRAVPEVEAIIVALPAEHLSSAPRGTIPVAGGRVRSESVQAALRGADATAANVIVHDAARVLASSRLFGDALALLGSSGADCVVAATAVTDTVKRALASDASGALRVSETLDRSQLWAVQTPQVFQRAVLERALDVSVETLAEATDDAWLVERAGGSVVVLPAPAENFKITTPLDLQLAELILSAR
jgi:2-C-methyl-D-erythritol 4-phosphate cytidylyltransferase